MNVLLDVLLYIDSHLEPRCKKTSLLTYVLFCDPLRFLEFSTHVAVAGRTVFAAGRGIVCVLSG